MFTRLALLKKLLAALMALHAFLTPAKLGGIDASSASSTISSVSDNESTYIQTHPKYQEIPKTDTPDFSYEVIEYQTPKGEVGYQTVITTDTATSTTVQSIGYGTEAKDRTQSWTKTKPISATSTPL